MSCSTTKLKSLWNEEKNHYRRKEVGTGVQSFIKKILESNEIFKLKEGKLSTKLQNRKNEFIHEKKAKQKRKADFYLYISPNIAIPVEAECYGNIQIGESQLLNYQKDFEKQYGILTDGFTWRFYNNNLYRVFTLDDILDNTSLFLTFWKEYIKPEGYYLAFFEKVGQLALTEEKTLHVEECRQSFFENITKLIQSFKNKLQIEGYLETTEDKSKEQRAIEITYAYIIQFILYKTLVDNEFDEFPQEFEQVVNTIHKSLKKKAYKDILGVINGISDTISKNIYRPFDKEQEFINKRVFELLRSLKNTLNDVSPWLDIFVFKQVGYTPGWVKKRYEFDKDSISLIDPACGSGTFLYAATDIIVQAFKDGYTEEVSKKIEQAVTKNIFGLDIEEFPLYLAEMSILMRLLPIIIHQKYNNPIDKKIKVFKTRDSVSEFMDTALRNTLSDINVEYQKNHGQMTLFTRKLNLGYSSYVRDEDDLKEMKQSLEQQPGIPRRRFDFVIGNPPYIGYNQASKEGVLIIKLIQQNKARMSNIYGVNLNTVPNRIKAYAPKPNLYAFFIALGLALLKENGKICYIVPQNLLHSNDLDVVRYHLAEFTTIEKIITFSGKVFLGRGIKQNRPIPTSSLIFVVSRKKPPNLHRTEIVNSKGDKKELSIILNNVSKNKNVHKKKVLQKELLRRTSNWNFIKHSKAFLEFEKEYQRNSMSIPKFRLGLDSQNDLFFDGGVLIEKNKVSNEKKSNKDFEIFDYKSNDWNRFTISNGSAYYSEKGPFRYPKGSQGIQTFKNKYKIIWRTRFVHNFQYTDRKILLVNNQSLAVTSNSKDIILYLFGLLNSPVNKLILEKMQKQRNEKNYLLPLRAIKSYIKIPRTSDDNEGVKRKVIALVQKLIEIETIYLSYLVDFSGVMAQKFDSVNVEKNSLLLKRDRKEIRLPIKKDKNLVKKTIEGAFEELKLNLDNKEISLSELISMPAIDYDKQKAIKDHIDDLVFALYFNVDIPKNKLNSPVVIKKLCQKNKFYSQIT